MGEAPDALRRDIENTRHELGGTLEAINDRVSPGRIAQRRKNRMVQGVHDLRDRVMGVADSASSSVSSMAASGRDAVGDGASSMSNAPDAVLQRTQGAPLVVGGLAAGLGFLMASLFPASPAEQQATTRLLEEVEPVKEGLTDAARDAAEHLKEPAMQAADAVKSSATDAAHEVTETAKTAADDAKGQAGQSAGSLKSSLPNS
jgi:hypothetical protein